MGVKFCYSDRAVLGYKLKLYPNATKRWMLSALAEYFAKEHMASLNRLAVDHPAKPVLLKGLKRAGMGEFKQRVIRRAVLDLQRQRKALARARKLCPWPVPLPKFKARLIDSAEVQQPRKATSYDLWVHVEGLARWCQLCIPAKLHAGINRALAMPGSRLAKSAEIFERDGQWYARVFVHVPPATVTKPQCGFIGVDVGVRTAVSYSDGKQTEGLHQVIRRQRDQLASRQRQLKTRKKNGLSRQCQVLAREARACVTLAARTGRGVALENPSQLIRWKQHAARFFAKRVSLLANLHGVPVALVNPAYTSRTCSKCHSRDCYRHRRAFHCFDCGHTANADVNAARNIAREGTAVFRAAQNMNTGTSAVCGVMA